MSGILSLLLIPCLFVNKINHSNFVDNFNIMQMYAVSNKSSTKMVYPQNCKYSDEFYQRKLIGIAEKVESKYKLNHFPMIVVKFPKNFPLKGAYYHLDGMIVVDEFVLECFPDIEIEAILEHEFGHVASIFPIYILEEKVSEDFYEFVADSYVKRFFNNEKALLRALPKLTEKPNLSVEKRKSNLDCTVYLK